MTAVSQNQSDGMFACQVAFGTKNLKLMQRQHVDLIVQNATSLRQFGLYRATRFDLDFVVVLPWTPEFFGCWDGYSTPVIGSLTEEYIKDYAYLMLRRKSVG